MRYLITLLFLLSALLYAEKSNRLSYEEKLLELRELVEIEFGYDISYFNKHEAVSHLYDMIYRDELTTSHFGEDKTIRKILVKKPFDFLEPGEVPESRVDLCDHKIIFYFDGSEVDGFLAALGRFKQELIEIEASEMLLKERFPNLGIKRNISNYESSTTTNKSYLHNLNVLVNVTANEDYLNRLLDFDLIQLNDTNSRIYRTEIRRYQTFFNKKALNITFGRDNDYSDENYINETTLRQYFDIILLEGFNRVEYYYITETEIKDLINELWNFLMTNNMSFFLKDKGVVSFKADRFYENEKELFSSFGRLTIGYAREDMQRVVDIVFEE